MTDQPFDPFPKYDEAKELWRKYFAGEPPFGPDVPLQFPKNDDEVLQLWENYCADRITAEQYSEAVLNLQPQIYDDVLLAQMRHSLPRPRRGPPVKQTVRARFWRMRYRLKCRVQQAIHDRLTYARCDG